MLKSPGQEVLKSPEKVILKSPEQEVFKSPEQEVLKSPEKVMIKSPEQKVLKSPEEVAPKTLEQVTHKPPENIAPKSSEDLEAQEIKPFPEIVKISAQSFQERDITKINVEAKTVEVSIEQTIQLDNETAVTNAKLNLGPAMKNKTVEVQDVILKTAELAASGKIEKNGSLKAAKDDMPAHQKTLHNNLDFKSIDVSPQPKVVKVAIQDVNEVRREVTAKRLEVSDTPKLMETDKVEPKFSSELDKRAAYDIPKDNDKFEKSFSKMAEKVAAAKQAVLGQKNQHTQAQVADTFNIESPKIRHHSKGKNTNLGLKPVIDFVSRTTQTFVAQQKGLLRKKSMGDASAMSSTVGLNADAATSQQSAASSGSQSQAGQGSSGSDMLGKWADSHLELSSRGWATNMAKTMVSALNRGQERLMFSLSPPSLGRISIAFTSTRGALDVRIQAERKATLALLGDAEGKLTSNLESAGHRVNSLSYADMNSGEAKFHFDHNQSSNNENKGKDKSDSLQEDKSASLEANAEGSVLTNKKADDSLVNITV